MVFFSAAVDFLVSAQSPPKLGATPPPICEAFLSRMNSIDRGVAPYGGGQYLHKEAMSVAWRGVALLSEHGVALPLKAVKPLFSQNHSQPLNFTTFEGLQNRKV
jgi:hypothetical protein